MYILVILFGVDKETLGTVLYAIPKYTWAFIPISFNVLVSSYLYSVKKAKESTIINFVRGFIVLLIVLLFLPRLLGKVLIIDYHPVVIYTNHPLIGYSVT